MTGVALALLAAAPHVVVVQRSLLGVPPAMAAPFLAQTRDRLQAAGIRAEVAQPCQRGSDCLAAAATAEGVDAAIGVSMAVFGDSLSLDLEAKDHAGHKLETWTGFVPAHTTWLPADADPFFAAVVKALAPAPHPEPVSLSQSASRLRPARPLFIATGAAAAVAAACGIGGLLVRAPLHATLQMMGVITTLTRGQATQQAASENALFTTSLIFGGLALALLAAGVAALLLQG